MEFRVWYNIQVNEPKFYLPFLAEDESDNESATPKGSAGAEASVNLPAESDWSCSGLKQAYTKSAAWTSVNKGKADKIILFSSFGLFRWWIKSWNF